MKYSLWGALALTGALAACSDSTSPATLRVANNDAGTSTLSAAGSGTAGSPTSSTEYVTCTAPRPSDLQTPTATEPRATLLFINAAPRYAGVNLCISSWPGWTNQPLGGGGGWYMTPSTIPHTLVVTAAGDSTVLASMQVTLGLDMPYTVVFTQQSSGGGLIVLTDTVSTSPSVYRLFRLVNVAPGVGAVDVYETTGSTDLTGLTPVASNIVFGASSPYVSEHAGPNRMIVTAAGHPETVLYDMGIYDGIDDGSIYGLGQVWTAYLMSNAGQWAGPPEPLTTLWFKDRS